MLALLDGELHGYALMRRVEELSDGAVRMGPGTLYGTLNRLVDTGLIEETTDRSPRGDNERRRYYELTPNGRARRGRRAHPAPHPRAPDRRSPARRGTGMTTPPRTLRVYRLLVRLYPERFREEYGPDLVGLVADQLRDEPTWRVLARSAIDLALTLPTRHLEAHMDPHRDAPRPRAVRCARTQRGHRRGSRRSSRRSPRLHRRRGHRRWLGLARRPPGPALSPSPAPATGHWWKLLAGGAGVLAALIAITTATGELPEGGWLIAMITGLTALVLLGAGIVLGIAHLAARPNRSPAA